MKLTVSEKLIGVETLAELKIAARKFHGDYTTELLNLIRKAKPTLSESQIVLIYRSIC